MSFNKQIMSSHPTNEPILGYEPGSTEKEALLKELNKQMREVIEIPCIINGEKIYTDNTVTQVVPHNHNHVLAKVHLAGKKEIEKACKSAINAQNDWINLGMDKRAQIFERCAELLAGKWRMKINASTMLNQSKTVFQAEIDAACELIDFWKFNAHYVREFHEQYQPLVSPEGNLNTTEILSLIHI